MKPNTFTERGQALIIIAFAAIGLFAIAGLAIDGSAKFSDRRHAQNAADTAALAAALAKVEALSNGASDNSPTTNNWATCPPPSGVLPSPVCEATQLAGLDRADSNGYDNNLVSNTVEVYSPPISGYYAGNALYVQAIITSNIDTYFARVIGINQTRNLVEAVAMTKEGGPLFDGAAFISVDPSPNCSGGNGSGGGSVDVSGNSIITLNGGGFFVNSNETCGYSQPNCSVTMVINGGGILSAGSNIYMQDKVTGTACNTGDPIPTDSTQRQYAVPGEIYMPKEPDECGQTAANADPIGVDANGVEMWLIHPGYYEDFPQATLIPNNKHIVMESGVYCVNDNLGWSGSSFKYLDGTSGVTIYQKAGWDISLTINSPILLNASSSGDYENYVIIQDGNMNSIQNCKFTGGQYLELNGTVFAPYCDITINGDSSTNSEFNAQFIGWDLKIDGNNLITVNYDPDYTPQIKHKVGLMH